MATRTRKNSLKGEIDLTCGETVSVFYPLTILGSKNPGSRVAISRVLRLRQDSRGAVVVDTLHLTRVATLYFISLYSQTFDDITEKQGRSHIIINSLEHLEIVSHSPLAKLFHAWMIAEAARSLISLSPARPHKSSSHVTPEVSYSSFQ